MIVFCCFFGLLTIFCFVKISKLENYIKELKSKRNEERIKNCSSRIYSLENKVDLLEIEETPLYIRKQRYNSIEKSGLGDYFDRTLFIHKRVRLAFNDHYGFENPNILLKITEDFVEEYKEKTEEEFLKIVNSGHIEYLIRKKYPEQCRPYFLY